MFRQLIDDFWKQAAQQDADAEELESDAWRLWDRDGDQSASTAAGKRGLATRLRGLARAYQRSDRE